jgi:hypothetical protein
MLESRRSTILPDHKPLTYDISRFSDSGTVKLSRQILYEAEYTSDLHHIADVNNIVG